MDSREQQLARRARRAYELGRLRHALGRAWTVVAIVAVAAILGSPITALTLGIPLTLLSIGLHYVGCGYDRAVQFGWRAGLAPMLIALTVWRGQGCTTPASPSCAQLCLGGSLVIGVWLGARMHQAGRLSPTLAAVAIAGLTASMACAALGVGTLTGALLGLALGVGPGWVWQRANCH